MKAPWIVLSVALAAAGLWAGVMWQSQSTQAAALAGEVAQLKADNAKLDSQLAAATEKAQALEAESAQLRAARAMAGARLEPDAGPSPTPSAPDDSGKSKTGLLARMFKDPEMRKMLAAQQAQTLRSFYSDFLKQAQLSPDETEKFFQLLQDRQMALMDTSANAMSGGQIDMKAASAATSAADDAIKGLLGPDRYPQYEAFEKTLGERIQVQQFSQQLGAQGAPLQDSQSQALIHVMSEEQANLPNFNSPNGAGVQQALNMTPAQIDDYSHQLDAMDERVYDRAATILSGPQLSAFAAYQKNMAAVRLNGLKMAQQMLKSGD